MLNSLKILYAGNELLKATGNNNGSTFSLDGAGVVGIQAILKNYFAPPESFATTVVDINSDTISVVHGYYTGQAVQFTTTGTLPSPLALSTTYYIIVVSAGAFRIATSLNNALANIFIDLTDVGTGTGTVTPNFKTATFLSSAVNTTTDTVALPSHGYYTGLSVQVSTTVTLPAPLLAATNYFIIVVDQNTIQFASSYANALAGTAIDLTTQGSGTDTITLNQPGTTITCNFDVSQDGTNWFTRTTTSLNTTSINPATILLEKTDPSSLFGRFSCAFTAGQVDLSLYYLVKGVA